MASPSTRKRIVDESYQTRYMNRIQLVLVEIACFCVAYKLVTDSTNCFAPSAVMAKYSLGLSQTMKLFCFVFLYKSILDLNMIFCWMFAPLICLGVFPIFLSIWHSYYLILYLKYQICMLIDVINGKVNLIPADEKEDGLKVFQRILKRHYEIIE